MTVRLSDGEIAFIESLTPQESFLPPAKQGVLTMTSSVRQLRRVGRSG